MTAYLAANWGRLLELGVFGALILLAFTVEQRHFINIGGNDRGN